MRQNSGARRGQTANTYRVVSSAGTNRRALI
jgi:hypothetical protein